MKLELALNVVEHIKAIEEVEGRLQRIGWDVQLPPDGWCSYSLQEVVMDLLDIPPEVNGFIRDMYFDCFYDNKRPMSVIDSLLKLRQENLPEYIRAGLVEDKKK